MSSFLATAGTPDDAGRIVVTVAGELDVATSATLRAVALDALDKHGCRALTVDLADLSFVDSSGLGVLLNLRNAARDRSIPFALANVPPIAARVITVAGLSNALCLANPPTVKN